MLRLMVFALLSYSALISVDSSNIIISASKLPFKRILNYFVTFYTIEKINYHHTLIDTRKKKGSEAIL